MREMVLHLFNSVRAVFEAARGRSAQKAKQMLFEVEFLVEMLGEETVDRDSEVRRIVD